MSNFYYKDYENYFDLFIEHAEKIAELMSQLNHQIVDFGMAPLASDKLFQMTIDLLYYVDNSYKEKNKITNKCESFVFKQTDEMLDSMRSLLKEELDRYMGHSDATNQ